MINTNQISVFILEVIKKTRQGKIVWEAIKPTIDRLDEPIVNFIYNSKIGGKSFSVYKFRTKYYHDEYDWEWTERIKFDMVNEDGMILYEFPYEYSLFDLYSAIQEQNSGISEVLNSMLEF
jgi:hypothetical protein